MFVFFSKFLPLLVYPLGLAIILTGLALLLAALKKWPRVRMGLIIAAFLILLVASNRWVSYTLARSLEWQYLPMQNIPSADVIVVLGGGTEAAQYPRPTVEVNSAGDRVLYAAKLYKQGKAPVLLLSGGTITWFEGHQSSTGAEEMDSLLEFMGIPKSALWLQARSENTHDDAELSAGMLKEKGVKSVILVTSAMHMPRSVALFRHNGIDVIPAPTDYTVTQAGIDNLNSLDPQSLLVNILPNTSSLSLTTNAMKEYLGLLTYRLKGWL